MNTSRRRGAKGSPGRSRKGRGSAGAPDAPAPLPPSVRLEVGLDEPDDMAALRARAARALGVAGAGQPPPLALRKKSLDCRAGRIRFHYLFEVGQAPDEGELGGDRPRPVTGDPVVIIGDGPCGLFCAYQLAREGIASIVLDRGKPVQPRRRDLKGLTRRGEVDGDSNYCFGEGGAGTYSDGKLYTRSHKRGDVRDVLEILALHGAPTDILIDARPHIGSNRLPDVITAMRQRLEEAGVSFRFGERVVRVATQGAPGSRHVTGVEFASGASLAARQVVLATGHSASDVYRMLWRAGHELQAKGFALGVRIEHPQALINSIQYGNLSLHPKLPSAAYQLSDSRGARSVFSFCMCPGGFIVPATTEPGHVVVNGMSPSRRNSRYANSGLVRSVEPEDWQELGFEGPLGGLDLQRQLEARAYRAGGDKLQAPATRVTDFLDRRASSTLPGSSYVPGLTACDLSEVLDSTALPLSQPLRDALAHFGGKLKSYLSEEAVLVGVESRTSSPVRIPRDAHTLESRCWRGLFPGGEGAGHAGGIMSAALDGMRIARSIAARRG